MQQLAAFNKEVQELKDMLQSQPAPVAATTHKKLAMSVPRLQGFDAMRQGELQEESEAMRRDGFAIIPAVTGRNHGEATRLARVATPTEARNLLTASQPSIQGQHDYAVGTDLLTIRMRSGLILRFTDRKGSVVDLMKVAKKIQDLAVQEIINLGIKPALDIGKGDLPCARSLQSHPETRLLDTNLACPSCHTANVLCFAVKAGMLGSDAERVVCRSLSNGFDAERLSSLFVHVDGGSPGQAAFLRIAGNCAAESVSTQTHADMDVNAVFFMDSSRQYRQVRVFGL